MAEFNLIEESWIPCIDLNGQRVEYGIRETFLKAHELQEICDDSPLVTVAIHRLLLAILYRVYEGPSDMSAWKVLLKTGCFKEIGIKKYLDAYQKRFYLLDDKMPFFQMAELETKKAVSVTRLATECVSGNNATLFDHSGDEKDAEWTLSQAAKQLIACQSFALGFGRSGDAKINKVNETLPYSADAIALRGMNIWLQGKTLFDTLTINLVPTNDDSLPPWEIGNPHKNRDRQKGKKKITVSSAGIVDRFTWQSRLIRFLPENGALSRMFFTQGRSADKSPGDPMKVYRKSKVEGISALSLSSSKAAWRDANSIFMIPAAQSDERRPECFNLIVKARLEGMIPTEKQFVAHVVGLASAPQKAGKFLLWRHDRLPISVALLDDSNLIERLGQLLQKAEQAAIELNQRTRRIAILYLSPDAEKPDGRKPDKDEVTRVADVMDPRPSYWARMERHFIALLQNLPNDWDETDSGWKPDEQQSATNAWREQVKTEAKQALGESIRSLGTTARAIQAVARVRTDFNDNDLVPLPQKKDKAKRKMKGGKKK